MTPKLKTITSVALSTILIFSSTSASFASVKGPTNKNSMKNLNSIQSAYYYVDGVKYEIPRNEYDHLINNDGITNLPYDPNKNTTTNMIRPNSYVCSPHDEFAGSNTSSGFQLGKSGTRVINGTSSPLTQVSQLSSTTSISGKVTGSGGWSWGPGDWGWIDYGTLSETWVGDYYHLTDTCAITNDIYLTVNGPKYKTILAHTETYPY